MRWFNIFVLQVTLCFPNSGHIAGTFTEVGYVGWHITIALVCNYEWFILVQPIDVIFAGILY